MKKDDYFKYKNPQNGLYVQGQIIEVKEDSYIVSLLGDFVLHEFSKVFLDNLEKVK